MKKYILSFIIFLILAVIVNQYFIRKKINDQYQCKATIENETSNFLKELPRYYSLFI